LSLIVGRECIVEKVLPRRGARSNGSVAVVLPERAEEVVDGGLLAQHKLLEVSLEIRYERAKVPDRRLSLTGVKPPHPGTTAGQASQGAGLSGHLPGVMCQESGGFLNRRS